MEKDPRHLSPELATTAELRPEHLDALAASGFKSVINNRPDGEGPDQPASAVIEATARACGLDYAELPVIPSRITGAALTGCGGVTALGCTVGQGTSGLSTLALGSLLAVGAIVAGAWAALRDQNWRIDALDVRKK